jgi:cell division septation protein DedD
MRNNETGEFELVVGNRQLLSGFFIVVLLFAVAFAMGYVVGQNSPRSSKLSPETAASAPVPVPAPDASHPAAGAAAPSNPADASSAQPPADSSASATGPAAASGAPPAEPATQPARQASAPAAAGVSTTPTPAAAAPLTSGAYWQAIAVPQSDAEVIAAGLKEKGFPIVLTPGTRNLTRVLVGPYSDKQNLGKAKTDLENAGFHPFLFK